MFFIPETCHSGEGQNRDLKIVVQPADLLRNPRHRFIDPLVADYHPQKCAAFFVGDNRRGGTQCQGRGTYTTY